MNRNRKIARPETEIKGLDVITVRQDNAGHYWQRIRPSGTIYSSTQRFPEALDAWTAAAVIAHCRRAVLRVPDHVRQALICQWELDGISHARRGRPRDLCWNTWQRNAFDAAIAETVRPVITEEEQAPAFALAGLAPMLAEA